MTDITVPTYTDAEFTQEVIDLIDGTHWTKGHLENWCPVPVLKGDVLPKNAETSSVWITYDVKGRMAYIKARQEWRFTPPSKRDTYEPADYESGGDDIRFDARDFDHATAAYPPPTYAAPVLQYTYRKAQWCLVGMILKVARLHMTEQELYKENDEDGSYRRVEPDRDQPWRIIDRTIIEIQDRYNNNARTAPSFWEPASIIQRVEEWNDDERRTKEDVREVMVNVRDHFLTIGEGS